MTRDDIIRMAREAGFDPDTPIKGTGEILAWEGHDCVEVSESLKRFAALVAAAEREACAKACDGWMHANGNDCAAAIRARGEV